MNFRLQRDKIIYIQTYRGGEVQFHAFLTMALKKLSGQLHASAAPTPIDYIGG
jgi:hypothetical protein